MAFTLLGKVTNEMVMFDVQMKTHFKFCRKQEKWSLVRTDENLPRT